MSGSDRSLTGDAIRGVFAVSSADRSLRAVQIAQILTSEATLPRSEVYPTRLTRLQADIWRASIVTLCVISQHPRSVVSR